jgi:hypothetical protein
MFVLSAAVAGCGGSDKQAEPAATTTTTNATDSTATTAPETSGGGGTVDADDPWNADPQQYRGKIGEEFIFECPAPGKESQIWGVETYTDDSSVCSAAVQVGLITFEKGGTVDIEIAGPQDEFKAGVANGVTSMRYGSWEGSFIFPKAPPGSGSFSDAASSWARNATEYRDKVGQQFTISCSADGTFGALWGTGTYTADSSICTAAVHSGVLTQADGGSVTIRIAAGEEQYEGSTANGVKSNDYDAYDSSFTIVNEPPEN